jgi:hypothetical protein
MEENGMKKISLTENPAPANRIDSMFLSGTEFREFALLFFFHGTDFRAFFSSAERFGTEFQEFSVPQMAQNRIPRVCYFFCSMVQHSKHFSPLRNGSERNSESFLSRHTAGRSPFRRARPFKKGAPRSEVARPYCLLDWQGAQALSGGLVIPSSSLMQLRVDEK